MRPFICERSTLKMRIKNIGKEYSCPKTIFIAVASGLLLVVLFGSFLYKKIGLNNVDSKELARLASYKSTLNFDDTMPKIGYVGKGQLVVYDNMGVYVYDLSSSDLTDYVDFEKNHFKGLQGDDATFIHVSKDGRYIQLSDNEKQLQYDLKTKQQKNQLDKKESWNPKTEPMGVETGLELGKKGSDIAAYKELMNLKVVNLIPSSMESFDFFRDSVYNEKSRSYVPAAYSSLMVSVDSHDSVGKVVAKYLLIYLHLGFSLWAVVLFIRLIISINKSDIFNWRNVRRLRRLGMALVVSFCCTFASSYLDFIGIDTVFSLHGYELSLSELVSTTTLVLGLCSLIVGEVFAIGLKMKEEQDLTI